MSDSSYVKVASRFIPAEIVDEGWLAESLSDDEVDLPKDLNMLVMEDLEEEDEDEGFIPFREVESFNDLGLDRFVLNLEAENNVTGRVSNTSVSAQALASAQRTLREERERGSGASSVRNANATDSARREGD